jgi:peptidoglycan/xylan/chitin deacetylase (PgdA/CDA1 family)
MSLVAKIINKLKRQYHLSRADHYLVKKIRQKKGVVFLMYHSTPSVANEYGYMTPKDQFEKQIRFISEYCKVITIDEAYSFLYENNKTYADRLVVVITFDDGYRDNFEVAYPVLKRYGMPFTIFLTTEFISNDNRSFMSWDEVAKLNDEPLATLGAHSKTHASLKALADSDKINEIVESKRIIEEKLNLNKEVKYFAYPGGGFDKVCLDTVEKNFKLGFKDRTNGDDDLDKRKVARLSIDGRHNRFKNFLIELANVRQLINKNG